MPVEAGDPDLQRTLWWQLPADSATGRWVSNTVWMVGIAIVTTMTVGTNVQRDPEDQTVQGVDRLGEVASRSDARLRVLATASESDQPR